MCVQHKLAAPRAGGSADASEITSRGPWPGPEPKGPARPGGAIGDSDEAGGARPACCGMEYMATACSHYDVDRFGAGLPRFSPRQADVMIVAGTVTYKMALAVKRIWDQMPEPKWCIAMGACASSGGMYRSYAVLQGIDRLIPVDVYISGCPPRPEALLEGLMRLQRKIEGEASFVAQKKELLESIRNA